MRIKILRVLARLAALLAVPVAVQAFAQDPPAPAPGTPQAAGRQIFLTRCASCHGTTGNGGEFAPGITTRIPLRSNDDLIRILHGGLPSSGMPAFPDLVDPDRANLISLPAHVAPAGRRRSDAGDGTTGRRRQPYRLSAQPLCHRHPDTR